MGFLGSHWETRLQGTLIEVKSEAGFFNNRAALFIDGKREDAQTYGVGETFLKAQIEKGGAIQKDVAIIAQGVFTTECRLLVNDTDTPFHRQR